MTKIALITGANRGLGKDIARKLQEIGWKIYVTARNIEELKNTYHTENIKYEDVFSLDLFQTTSSSMKNIFSQLPPLSAVIHCASPYTTKTTLDIALEEQEQYGKCMANDQLLMRLAAEKLINSEEKSVLMVTGAVIGLPNFYKRGIMGLLKAQQRQFSGILQEELGSKYPNKFFVRHLNLGSFRDEVSDPHLYISTNFVVNEMVNILKRPENYPDNTHLVSEANEKEYEVRATIKFNSPSASGTTCTL